MSGDKTLTGITLTHGLIMALTQQEVENFIRNDLFAGIIDPNTGQPKNYKVTKITSWCISAGDSEKWEAERQRMQDCGLDSVVTSY